MVLATPTLSSENFTLINPNTPQNIKDDWENLCEKYRTKYIKEFIPDHKIDDWEIKSTLEIKPGNKKQGATTYGQYPSKGGYRIEISGDVKYIVNNILPHEVMHTVIGTYYNNIVPRWADEGYCTYLEPNGLNQYTLKREVPFKIIMNQMEYPEDYSSFYSQSTSMVGWLVDLKGRIVFRNFIGEYITSDKDWEPLLKKYYGFDSYQEAQRQWKMRGLVIYVSK